MSTFDAPQLDEFTAPSVLECERCAEQPATVNRFDVMVCSDCDTSMNEAAYERSLSDYYGGASAQNESERTHAAHAAKREGR